MDIFLIQLIAFFRPLASMDYAEGAFDMAAIVLFGVAILALISNGAIRKSIRFTAVDALILTITVWCVAIYFIQIDKANIRDVVKLLIPMISFTVVKNVIREPGQYRRLLLLMIVGFGVTAVLSVARIVVGQGMDYVNYWTSLPRWRGVFANSHNFGHSMALFLMLMVIYAVLLKRDKATRAEKFPVLATIALGGCALLAIYGLYMSQVRSAIVGLLVFGVICGFARAKRSLIMVGGAGIVLGIALFPYWAPALLPDVITGNRTTELEWSNFGSGRPGYWRHNIEMYGRLPLDQQIAGVGLGNRTPPNLAKASDVLDSHNDWLDMLMQTGLIGLLLFAALQVLLLRAILRLDNDNRYLYLALFLAVNAMMLISNSYAWRIQVAHPYYMMLAYIEFHYVAVLRRGSIEAERPVVTESRIQTSRLREFT